jgi:hypothetical protein
MNCPTARTPVAAVPNFRKSRRDNGLFIRYSACVLFLFPYEAGPVDQVEKQDRDERKENDEQKGADVEQFGDDDIPVVGDARNNRKYLLVSEAEKYCTNEEAQQTRDEIIKLSFAATGGASTRSEPGQGHPYAKDQSTDHIAGDIGRRDVGELKQTEGAQAVQPTHGYHQGGHHKLQDGHVGETKDIHDFVIFGQPGLVQGKAEEDSQYQGSNQVGHINISHDR